MIARRGKRIFPREDSTRLQMICLHEATISNSEIGWLAVVRTPHSRASIAQSLEMRRNLQRRQTCRDKTTTKAIVGRWFTEFWGETLQSSRHRRRNSPPPDMLASHIRCMSRAGAGKISDVHA